MTQPSYSTRPTARIDLSRIRSNYDALSAKVGKAKIGACVKADAYGLGAEAVGRALYGAGCRIFFVATAGEGKILREAIGPNGAIYVLNGPAPRDRGVLLGARLKPVINSLDQARFWAEVSREVNEPPYTAIHIDTGMNRLGLTAEEVETLSRDKALWRALSPEWVMSHLACGPDSANPMNKEQLKRFKTLSTKLPLTPLSFANSAGIYLGSDYHFQMVRPGIALYGGNATNKPEQEVTRSAVRLLAPILQIREVKAGESVGYNASFTADRDMRLAILGAGYGDGVPVALSNTGQAIIHDQAVPIIGRVSMDLTIIDVTDVHLPVQVGGVVEFLGDNLSAQAEAAGTINYELLVRLGQRCRRDYLRSQSKSEEEESAEAHSRKRPGKPREGSKTTLRRGDPNKGPSGRKPGGRKPARQSKSRPPLRSKGPSKGR